MKCKKILALLVSGALMVSLAACSGKTDEKTSSADKSKTEATQEKDKKEVNGEITKSKLWQAALPKGWTEDTKNADEPTDDYDAKKYVDSSGKMIAYICVKIDKDPTSFRKEIVDNGHSLKDFADGKLDNMTKVDDNDAIVIKASGEVEVLSRDAKANADIIIDFTGDDYSEEMKGVVDSFSLLTEDVDQTDAPYPWDGEKLSFSDKTVKVGSVDLAAHMMNIDESVTTYETFLGGGVQAGDYIYLLNKNNLLIYKNAEPLKLEKTVDLGDDYEFISVANDGKVYVSDFMKSTKIFTGTEETGKLETKDNFIISPKGTWGLEYFTDITKIQKVDLGANSSLTKTPITFDMIDGKAFELVSNACLSDDKIFICGTISSNHVVGVYDVNGKLLAALKGENGDSLGSITGMVEGKSYYLGSDGNMRSFVLWSKDGAYIGEVEDGDLFGTSYPWICNMAKGNDGNIYAALTQKREDDSSNELILFKITANL